MGNIPGMGVPPSEVPATIMGSASMSAEDTEYDTIMVITMITAGVSGFVIAGLVAL